MGSDPRFGSGVGFEAVRPLFSWGSRQSEPQVREPKRNGYFRGCHWETLGPRPPEYGHEQEGPVQFQWVTWRSILSGDSFFWKTVSICPVAKHPRSRAHLSTYHPHTDETAKVSGSFFESIRFFQIAGSSARARSITCCIERCWLICLRFNLCAIMQRP